MTAAASEHYVAMLEFAACAMAYVTGPGPYPGYVAFLEQSAPDLPPETTTETVRLMMAADAEWFAGMARTARARFEQPASCVACGHERRGHSPRYGCTRPVATEAICSCLINYQEGNR